MVDNQSNGGHMAVNRSVVRSIVRPVVNSIISAIRRHFTTLTAAGSQYYTIPTVTLTGGLKIELDVYPTVDQQHLLAESAASGQDRVFMATGSQGLRVNVAGSIVQFNMTVPLNTFSTVILERDGFDVWSASLNGTDASVFSGQGASGPLVLDSIARPKGAATSIPYFSGIIANASITDAGTLSRFYKIDEDWTGPSTVLHDSSGNNQHGTAVNITLAELFTQQSNGDWLGMELITQAVWESPFVTQLQWAFSNNQWTLTGTGTDNLFIPIREQDQPEVMRLTGNVVALTGTGLDVQDTNPSTNNITTTGAYSADINKTDGTSQVFSRTSGVVNATLDKPSLKQLLEKA